MKKTFLTVLLICILSIIGGCSDTNEKSEIKENTEHQELSKNNIAFESEWLKVDLSKVGLSDIAVGDIEKGHFTKKSFKDNVLNRVYVLYDYNRFGEDSMYYNSYLAVTTESKVLFFDLSTNNSEGCYGEELFVSDIDGDEIDEIILHQTVGLTGGAGQYQSRIFRVIENNIEEVFLSTSKNKYDTGYLCELKRDFKLCVKNDITDYSTTIDVKDKQEYIGVYFDENGNPIDTAEIMIDNFCDFKPEDVDNDGIDEIVAKQYVSLNGHMDCIGYAESVLKYNSKSETFEVVNAKFLLLSE